MTRYQKNPPIGVALVQAAKEIRMRPVRQIGASLGVFLGIAFFSSVRTAQFLGGESSASSQKMRWLVALSLLMCLVGITNSMLMSVTERYKEIGTLKCLGATNHFIVVVFLLEALIVGTISSLLGAIAGVLLIAFVRMWSEGLSVVGHDFLAYAATTVLTSLCLGTAISAVAAVLPAWQAAKMPAASALRVEV